VAQDPAERALEIALGEDVLRQSRRQHRAVEQHRAIAEFGHAAQIVGGDQHDAPLRTERAEQFDDGVLGLDVDAGERLVQQDDMAVLGKRAGQENALLLPAGKLADLPLAKSLMPTRSSAASTASRSSRPAVRSQFMRP
jgi:hypothetical protein